jgi:hypothetical protein
MVKRFPNFQCFRSIGKIILSFWKIWFDGEGFLVANHSLISPPKYFKNITKVGMCLNIIRLYYNGLTEVFSRFINPPKCLKNNTQVVMCLRKVRVNSKRLVYEINSNIVFANLMSNYAE